MKILIIGRSGQLARSLHEAQKPNGWQIVLTGRPQLDLSNADSIGRQFDLFSPDIVINAAAYTAVDKAEDDEALAFAINSDGPACLAQNCEQLDIPLIHVSTDYVFEGNKPSAYVESDPVAPEGVYGRSKLAGEEAVRNKLAKHIILRTAWVYSPFEQNFAKTMLRLANDRDELRIVGDQHGCPTYAPHLADGILGIVSILETMTELNSLNALWGTYHMTGNGEATWATLAHEIFARSKELDGPSARVIPITTNEYPTAATRPANSRLDCTKLYETSGIRLPDWQVGVARCVKRILREEKS